MTRLTRFLILGFALLAAQMALAQSSNPFAPRIIVNDRAITNWEVEQRIQFLTLLNAPGDLEEQALEGLIEDRLRLDAADALGIEASDEAINAGMAEFAGRANLTTEQFIVELGKVGIAGQTFRDFVAPSVAWRDIVRGRFAGRSQVTEEEIDRAIALSTQQGNARVLLAEIILRADTPEFQAQSQKLADELSQSIKSTAAFGAAARKYSASQTAGQGGRTPWIDLANLPPQISSQVLSLAPGEVTAPIPIPNAIALFQLRELEENDPQEPDALTIEYARFFVAQGARKQAPEIVAEIDTCDDLYGIAKGLPEETLLREVKPVAEISPDVALALAKLDNNESAILNGANGASVVMLCGRTPALGDEEIDREQFRVRLVNQRLVSYAESYLEELKADAIIRQP